MDTVHELISLLRQALSDHSRMREAIGKFQEKVWDSVTITADPRITEIFRDLAYDLDLCEDDADSRAGDQILCGESRSEREIRLALDKLADLGLPPEPMRG